eukprot:3792975-Rhodomonas_salina.1
MANNDFHAPLENWVRQIRDVQRIHKAELDKVRAIFSHGTPGMPGSDAAIFGQISDPEKKERRLIELNTLEQAANVYKEA